MSQHVDPIAIDPIEAVFGPERTLYHRRARLTGEKRWRARALLGRQGSLGMDPIEAGQIRFQAFLSWSLWGEPTSPLDPGGHSRRALAYSFTHSQGPNFWEIGGVARYSDNLPSQFLGGWNGYPEALPGFCLEGVDGCLISLSHEPTGGWFRARVNSSTMLAGESPAGSWNPVNESPLSYDAMPELTDEASVLLAAVLSRIIGLDRALVAYRRDLRAQQRPYDMWCSDGMSLLCAGPNVITLDASHGSHAIPYPLLEAIFSLPGLAPPQAFIERYGRDRGIVHRGDARMWIIGSPVTLAP